MIKFILDAMYYQIFIFNRDKFILENPHERTIQIICGILFLPVIVLTYLLIEENFIYKTPFEEITLSLFFSSIRTASFKALPKALKHASMT